MWDLTIHPLWVPMSSLTFVPFSNRCETPQYTPLWSQCPCWKTASCPPPSGLNLLAGIPPRVHPLQGSVFSLAHHSVFCSPPQPMWDLTIHPPTGPSFLDASICSFLQSMSDPQSTPFGANVLAGTPPHVHPHFRAQPSRWHIARCLALILFVTA